MFSVRDNDTLTTPGQPKLNCTFALGFPSIFVCIISYHSMQDTVTSTEIRSQSPHNRTQTQAGQTDGASSIKTLADQLHLLSMRWPLTVGCTYTGRTELVFMLKTVCFLQHEEHLVFRGFSHTQHHHPFPSKPSSLSSHHQNHMATTMVKSSTLPRPRHHYVSMLSTALTLSPLLT